jgi:hypothetical protein
VLATRVKLLFAVGLELAKSVLVARVKLLFAVGLVVGLELANFVLLSQVKAPFEMMQSSWQARERQRMGFTLSSCVFALTYALLMLPPERVLDDGRLVVWKRDLSSRYGEQGAQVPSYLALTASS